MSIAAIIVLAFAALSALGLVETIRPVLDQNSSTTFSFGRFAMTGSTAAALVLFSVLTYGLYKAPSEAKIWDLDCLSNAMQVKQARDGSKTMCEAADINCEGADKEPPADLCATLFTPLW